MITQPSSTVNFKITLEVGECNGFMKSRWFANGECVAEVNPTSNSDIDVEFFIKLPCTIRVELTGKNLATDTKLDDNGLIMQDKFIKIKNMWLAKRPVPEHVYMNMCNIESENGNFTAAYFSMNGAVTINFAESDAILWHFRYNHYKVS